MSPPSPPSRQTMERKAQPRLLRQINERAVFELVRRTGRASRAQLKRAMGISAPTVSKAVARLLRAGLLEEIGTAPHAPAGGAGRPVTVYRLAGPGLVRVLGAAIAVHETAVVVAGLDGQIDAAQTRRFPTPSTYPALLAQLAQAARDIISASPADCKILGIGVSTPGSIDAIHQRVLISPNLPFLNTQSPSRDLARLLDIPAVMFHDMAGSCLAEQHYGSARNYRDFVRIGVYEGFGAAAVLNGRLVEGHSGLAGELGHVTVDPDGPVCGCGNRGCLETVATDAAFARALSRRLHRDLGVDAALHLAAANDPDATAEMHRALGYLAIGVAAAINLFNPQAVFLSSRLLESVPAAHPLLTTFITQRTLPPHLAHCAVVPIKSRLYAGAIAGMIQHLVSSLGPSLDTRSLPI